MDVNANDVNNVAWSKDGFTVGGTGSNKGKLGDKFGGGGNICNLVEEEGAWMPDRPVQVLNAPEANTWSSSESKDLDSKSKPETP
jgi:hypothetical protein